VKLGMSAQVLDELTTALGRTRTRSHQHRHIPNR